MSSLMDNIMQSMAQKNNNVDLIKEPVKKNKSNLYDGRQNTLMQQIEELQEKVLNPEPEKAQMPKGNASNREERPADSGQIKKMADQIAGKMDVQTEVLSEQLEKEIKKQTEEICSRTAILSEQLEKNIEKQTETIGSAGQQKIEKQTEEITSDIQQRLQSQTEKIVSDTSQQLRDQTGKIVLDIEQKLQEQTEKITSDSKQRLSEQTDEIVSQTGQKLSGQMEEMISRTKQELSGQMEEMISQTGQKLSGQIGEVISRTEQKLSGQIGEVFSSTEQKLAIQENMLSSGREKQPEKDDFIIEKFEELKKLLEEVSKTQQEDTSGNEITLSEEKQMEFSQKFALIQNLIIDSVRREDAVIQQIASELNGRLNDIVERMESSSKADSDFVEKICSFIEEKFSEKENENHNSEAPSEDMSVQEAKPPVADEEKGSGEKDFVEVNSVTIAAEPSGEQTIVSEKQKTDENIHTEAQEMKELKADSSEKGELTEENAAAASVATREILEKLDEIKNELGEKIHSETVRCYRNIRSLMEEKPSDDSSLIRQEEPSHVAPENLRSYLRFILWISLLNTVLFILIIIGIL